MKNAINLFGPLHFLSIGVAFFIISFSILTGIPIGERPGLGIFLAPLIIGSAEVSRWVVRSKRVSWIGKSLSVLFLLAVLLISLAAAYSGVTSVLKVPDTTRDSR